VGESAGMNVPVTVGVGVTDTVGVGAVAVAHRLATWVAVGSELSGPT
jgi:hypothetical protein